MYDVFRYLSVVDKFSTLDDNCHVLISVFCLCFNSVFWWTCVSWFLSFFSLHLLHMGGHRFVWVRSLLCLRTNSITTLKGKNIHSIHPIYHIKIINLYYCYHYIYSRWLAFCGVCVVVQAFLPLMQKAANAGSSKGLCCARAAIVNFSTRMGSIDDNTSGGIYAYRSSKVCSCLDLLFCDRSQVRCRRRWLNLDYNLPQFILCCRCIFVFDDIYFVDLVDIGLVLC